MGGETGNGLRPMDARWPRNLRDLCTPSGVAFWFIGHSGTHQRDTLPPPIGRYVAHRFGWVAIATEKLPWDLWAISQRSTLKDAARGWRYPDHITAALRCSPLAAVLASANTSATFFALSSPLSASM